MNWNNILSSDCTVCKLGPRMVYPIFRCGFTSIRATADKTYVNEEIKTKNIDVLIRDPADRFMSGVNEYARQNKVEVEDTWNLIAQNKLIDKHFAPQYVWLMHLQKFHKGTVTLYPFKDIKKFTKKHTHKWSTVSATEKEPVAQIEEFVDKDFLLLKYLNKTVTIKELLKNVLS
tara:strand:- start:1805 stop:2326 length:522 start_codon:yes stop_codon:yes gene_type:complete